MDISQTFTAIGEGKAAKYPMASHPFATEEVEQISDAVAGFGAVGSGLDDRRASADSAEVENANREPVDFCVLHLKLSVEIIGAWASAAKKASEAGVQITASDVRELGRELAVVAGPAHQAYLDHPETRAREAELNAKLNGRPIPFLEPDQAA